jgi:type VI secretion system protein ImpM
MMWRAPSAAMHAIGWHGKLPTVGDFATRRLDSNFVAVWDEWLSAGLARLRSDDPDHWLDAYLASPTWRFVITPGFLPAPMHAMPWAGVVMPSVDKVGRYYPLTLAATLRALPVDPRAQLELWLWLQRLEDAAIDALQEDWSIDLLETELLRLGLPPEPLPGASNSGFGPVVGNQLPDWPSVASPASMESFFAAFTSIAPAPRRPSQCLWYNEADISAPRIMCSAGLDGSVVQLWKP